MGGLVRGSEKLGEALWVVEEGRDMRLGRKLWVAREGWVRKG